METELPQRDFRYGSRITKIGKGDHGTCTNDVHPEEGMLEYTIKRQARGAAG
jgi:hypothetical protein